MIQNSVKTYTFKYFITLVYQETVFTYSLKWNIIIILKSAKVYLTAHDFSPEKNIGLHFLTLN